MRNKIQKQQRRSLAKRRDDGVFKHTAGKTHSCNLPDLTMRGGHRF